MAGRAQMTSAQFLQSGLASSPRGKSSEARAPVRSKAEHAFQVWHDARRQRGEILACLFRPFAIPVDTWEYVPRFVIVEHDGVDFVEFDEPRQALETDFVARWRTAAQRWPGHQWVLYRPKRGVGFEVVEWRGGEK